jgi:hypothetical protein
MSWSSLSAWTRIRLDSAAFFSETVFCLAAAVLLHQDVAQLRCGRRGVGAGFCSGLRLQAGIELLLGQRTALDQDFAQAHGFFGQGLDQVEEIDDFAVGRQDVEIAIVAAEVEHLFDRCLGGMTAKVDFETQVALLRVHLVGLGQGVGERGDVGDFAQVEQIAQEGQRVHAVLQHVGAETN